ncbi:MAG: flagellar hook capping FlgD N-terminal domain-containing protein [Candidatus Eremiobacterota bacterium]
MSQVNAVTGVTGTETTSGTEATKKNITKNELGKDQFLELLIKQLQNQDPLSPTDNTEFIAQLAQFSSLEQMNNLNSSFEKLMSFQMVNQAASFIDKSVVIKDDSGKEITGTVEKVVMQDGSPKIVVNGNEYAPDQIQEILKKEE